MRILLRRFDNEEYVWKDAKITTHGYEFDNGMLTSRQCETNVVAVDGQSDFNYVVCKNCGKLIENTPEAIEAHFAEKESERDCTTCRHLQFESGRKPKREMKDNGDGTYSVVESFTSKLYCTSCYTTKSMEDPRTKRECVFSRCRKNGVQSLTNIFIKYPGVFDTAITSDVLIEKKLKFDGYDGNFYLYDMKSRGTIKACVNKSGIVECFRVSSNGDKMYFYYSEKYDKLFYATMYDMYYTEGKPSWFRDNKFNEAYEKIKALYKGVE